MAALGQSIQIDFMELTMVKQSSYETPELRVHGDLEGLTRGQATGTQLDASFPTGTPFGDLTFS